MPRGVFAVFVFAKRGSMAGKQREMAIMRRIERFQTFLDAVEDHPLSFQVFIDHKRWRSFPEDKVQKAPF